MKRVGFLVLACGLIVVTNLALLAAAAWNRRGEPQSELLLTERELALPAARQDEGTGLELELLLAHEPPGVIRRTARWKRYELPPLDYGWLDRDKLVDLGFEADLDPETVDLHEVRLARRVWLVLEQDGPAWHRWITAREEHVDALRRDVAEGRAEPNELADAEALLAADRTMRSRLFPVDAGTDAEVLRRRYGDRGRYAVVAGLIRPRTVRDGAGPSTLRGEIVGPVVGRVHVPRTLREPLESLLPEESWGEVERRERSAAESDWPSASPPRYAATVAIGARHEPWLVGLDRER